jgi:hypothetical protein
MLLNYDAGGSYHSLWGHHCEVGFTAGDCWTAWPVLTRGEGGHGGQGDEEHHGVEGHVPVYLVLRK